MNSIRHKTSRAFYLLALFIALLSLFAFINLLYLQQQVKEEVEIGNFKDDILEMRRHEKNLFLYQNQDELRQCLLYTKKAISNLNNNIQSFKKLPTPIDLTQLQQLLNDYLKQLQIYQSNRGMINTSEMNQLLRPLGHQLSVISDQIASQESQSLIQSLNTTRWTLAGAILITAFITVFIGYRLSRLVVRPLRELENNLEPIAQGKFEQLQVNSQEQEIIAFTEAFNRMLHELDLRKKRLLHTEKLASLGVLISGVAHELNNPLGNILSSCQLLKEELHSADKALLQNWLEQIDNETMRAHQIVQALRNFGQQQDSDIEPVYLSELVDNTVLLLRNDLKQRPPVIKNIPSDLQVQVDQQRFQQVLINLLKNALDAGDQSNQIEINATGCRKTAGILPAEAYIIGDIHKAPFSQSNWTRISIKDSGNGLEQEQIKHIFDPFYTTKAPGKGMGLGLYIVQEIIQDHGGDIAVISQPGQGAEFIIRLPCTLKGK